MKTFLGIIFGGIVSALAGVGAHFLIERLNREKVRREKFQTALSELEQEIQRLITWINASDFEKSGFNSWDRDLLERKWKAVQQDLTKEVEFKVSSAAQDAIGCLGSGASLRRWMGERLADFLNKATWLINTADDVYDAGSKHRKQKK
jgi:hypothetical protein